MTATTICKTLALAALVASLPVLAKDDPRAAQVDRIFARWGLDTPGCVVGVAEKGRPVLTRAYGMADLEHNIKNTPDTIFEAGSVSKQFTAMAVALLARDGKLSLDDPARKYLPELPDYGVPLTIRHMLNHTSGLRDWGAVAAIGGWPRGSRVYDRAQLLDIVKRQRALNFTPGSAWSYSNTGYSLAAVIVERVSGQSFAAFTEERIFKPLGMTHTSWRDDYTRVLRQRAIAYDLGKDGFHTDMPFENVVGNGGLLTTVGDLLKWNENFARPVVGDATLLAEAQTPGTFSDGKPHNYGMGLVMTSVRGVAMVYHGGATAGYRSVLSRYPERALSVAVLCNAGNAKAAADGAEVAEVYLGPRVMQAGSTDAPLVAPRLKAQPPGPAMEGPLDPEQARELPGRYASIDADAVYTFTVDNGVLVGHGRDGVKLPLQAVSKDKFRVDGTAVNFLRDAEGRVNGMSVVADRAWDVRFERQ